jgi:hypothetical protein
MMVVFVTFTYLPIHPPTYYNLPTYLLQHTYLPTHPLTYLLYPTYLSTQSSTHLLTTIALTRPPTLLLELTYLPTYHPSTHLSTYYNLPTHPPTYVPHSLVVMCQNKDVKFVLTKVEYLWWCGPLVKDLVYHWGGQGFNFW